MALKVKSGITKGAKRRPAQSSASGSASKVQKKTKKGSKPTTASQHKPKPTSAAGGKVKKPLHLRYSEKQLGVPRLNGIKPAGVQKPPNQKKGKQFVDDGDGMRTILAMVMAEKEGNIESKMMRARQLEEIREAKRVEAEKRAEGKKALLEDKKSEVKGGKRRRSAASGVRSDRDGDDNGTAQPARKKKKVSFG